MLSITIPKQKKVHVTSFPFVIGRKIHCDLVINDKTISAIHAEIIKIHDELFLVDRQSTNGIFEAGEKKDQVLLNETKVVYLGGVEVHFLIDADFEKTKEISLEELRSYTNSFQRKKGTISLLREILVVLMLIVYFHMNTPITENSLESSFSWIAGIMVFQLVFMLVFSFLHKIQNKYYGFFNLLFYTQIFMYAHFAYNFLSRYLFFYLDWFEVEGIFERQLSIWMWLVFLYFVFKKTFSSIPAKKMKYGIIGLYILSQTVIFSVKYYTGNIAQNNYRGLVINSQKEYPREKYSLFQLKDLYGKSHQVVDDYRQKKMKKILGPESM